MNPQWPLQFEFDAGAATEGRPYSCARLQT